MTKHVRALSGASAVALAVALGKAPRGLISGVRADAGAAAEAVGALTTELKNFKTEYDTGLKALQKVVADFRTANDEALNGKADAVTAEKVDRVNAAVDELKTKANATAELAAKIEKEIGNMVEKMAALTAGAGTKAGSQDPRMANPSAAEYCNAFDEYFRRGGDERALRQLEIKAAMTSGSDADGGFTVRPEMETQIDEVLKEVSPMRQLATIRTIGTDSYKKLVNQHGTASGWVGETDSRPQTEGAKLSELAFPVMELYAMPAASQGLLDDSFVDMGAWLAGEVELEFAAQEGAAFITGNGVKKPNGFIGGYDAVADASYVWGKIGYIATGAAGAYKTTDTPPVGADCLVDLYHAPKSAYRKNGTWLANRKTLGVTRKLKDGQGNYLLNMVFRPEGVIEEILGRPAVEMPDMPDIGANSFSVAFGDFKRGYLIVDRIGIRILRDPFTAKPYVLFYTTKRVGGGVQNFEAIKLLKFAAS